MVSIKPRSIAYCILITACIVGAAVSISAFSPASDHGKKGKQSLATRGACTQTDREKVMYHNNHRFTETWDDCGRATSGSEHGTIQCIKRSYPELSSGCAACIGRMTTCSKEHCMWACMFNSNNANCRQCTRENCSAELYRCTGIPEREFPR